MGGLSETERKELLDRLEIGLQLALYAFRSSVDDALKEADPRERTLMLNMMRDLIEKYGDDDGA